MKFRLIYQGPLPSSSSAKPRARFKYNLRKYFHNQLSHLWSVQQPLAGIAKQHNVQEDHSTGTVVRKEWTGLDELADAFRDKHGIRWAPLINTRYGLVCELDILLLRRANPGNITTHGGDVDNRIKTLLDTLTIPQDIPPDLAAKETNNPFFCLMESDALVTQLRITVDRLLMPLDEIAQKRCTECIADLTQENTEERKQEKEFRPESDVYTMIEVHPLIADPNRAYIEFSM